MTEEEEMIIQIEREADSVEMATETSTKNLLWKSHWIETLLLLGIEGLGREKESVLLREIMKDTFKEGNQEIRQREIMRKEEKPAEVGVKKLIEEIEKILVRKVVSIK
jgi:hypothetical protein